MLKFLKYTVVVLLVAQFTACDRRGKAIVIKSSKLEIPISCMALSEVGVEKDF